MKKYTMILAAAALLAAACNKQEAPADNAPVQNLVPKTFTVTAPGDQDDPELKTTLAADGLTINWSAGDEINVIGVTADGTVGQHTFTIASGAGTASATFEGEVGENETTFYAVYPNVAIRAAQLTAATPLIEVDASLGNTQTAVKNGFDSHFAPMTAVADAEGNFVFRHGAAYFKITIGNDNVESVNLKTSNTRFGGRPQYNLADGSYYNVQSAKDNITLSGTLEKGGSYYIPVLCKNSTLQTLTVTYSFSDGTADKSISTDKLSTLKPELGKIYDLKTVTFNLNPEIQADDIILDADATSGSISYSLANPVEGGVVTAALAEASDWLGVGTVSDGSVSLSATANTGEARSAVVTLTYTYGDSQTVTTDVTVSQKGASAQDLVTLTWDFTSDKASGTPAVGKTYKYENGAFSTVVTEITETETLYLVNGKGAKFASKSMTVTPKTKYYYLSYGGNADYLVFKTAMKGTLSVYATMNVESGEYDCMMGVKVDGTALSNTFDVGFLDTSKEMLGATAGTWTIDNTTGSVQEIQIIKTTGNKSPWVYKIVFEQSE